MRVPAHWWAGSSGNNESLGQIAGVNFSDDFQRYFLLELDGEKGAHYPMQYNAVSLYAYKDAPCIHNYNVPTHVIRNPTDVIAQVRRTMVSRWLLNNHYKNTYDG